jgi:hypothetical protein
VNSLIESIEEQTGYFFKKMSGEYACFVSGSEIPDKFNYHYYKEQSCSICGKPYIKKKYTSANSHKLCTINRLNYERWL